MKLHGACHCGECSWVLNGEPQAALRCNCTVCRRYGALWVYGYDEQNISIQGATLPYQPADSLAFHACSNCRGLMYWRALEPNDEGFYRVGLNLRMADPGVVADLPLDQFDGLDTWQRSVCPECVVADVF